jgi:hypothetical protein
MIVKDKFVELTTRTYPHGTEKELFQFLPDFLETDAFGNRYYQIGETPSTMFTSHLDTVHRDNVAVTHVFDGDFIKTDGKSILGADDKAGVTVMLYMIEHKIPGLYYFFLGEEVGCVGSKKLSDYYKNKEKPEYIKKVVAFDRRGTDSIITFQGGQRCCSEDFGNALSSALNEASKKVEDNDTIFNYKTDPTGVYTDSAQFIPIYAECTNVSVGYYSEHQHTERQNIKHLDKLAKACVHVDWEALPVKRDPTTVERKYANSYSSSSYNRRDDHEQYEEFYNGNSRTRFNNQPKDEKIQFIDYDFGKYISTVTKEKSTGKIKSVDFALERLKAEKELIAEFFKNLEVKHRDLNWGGDKLIIWYDDITDKKEVSRADLLEFIPELNFWVELAEKQKELELFDEPTWMF